MPDREPRCDPWDAVTSRRDILQHGHRYPFPETAHRAPYRAKPASQDDGPLTGMFLGGMGAPVCGRNLDGRFSRWHLQNGHHVNQTIDEAFFTVRWSSSSASDAFRLAESGTNASSGSREVFSLFPVIHETYSHADVPLEIAAEFFSPIIPGDSDASSLPLWIASLTVRNVGSTEVDVDAACFWPNQLGWRVQQMPSVDRPARSWPSQTHSGNTARLAEAGAGGVSVRQLRHPERPVVGDMEGTTVLWAGLGGDSSSLPGVSEPRVSYESCFKAGQNAIDRPPHQQGHTVAWAEHNFRTTGRLPQSNREWTAHWDEAIGSAASCGCTLAPGASARLDFIVVFDWPLVRFGSGRSWYRRHCRLFGREAGRSLEMIDLARAHMDGWRETIATWHAAVIGGVREAPGLAGLMINELSFLNGGGTVWVDGCVDQRDHGIEPPLLGGGEHFGILEGYDIGYCYYNTSDLWPYAWYAVARWWPDAARNVFGDLLSTVPIELAEEKLIYRTETMARLTVAGKIPHDLGSVMEDPWHRINGYQMRDNSNLWKDHNPAFLLSLALHHRVTGHRLNDTEWRTVREAALFALAQADPTVGLPVHDEFGDSTWDNLGIRGRAAYSGSLTIGALAALVRWSEEFSDGELEAECRRRLQTAQHSFVDALWTGEYYRVSDTGKYADCIMGDSVLGFFLADAAGLGGLISDIDRETIRSHLRAAHRYCFTQYADGRVGPLLLAAKGQTRFSGDGGDELQVNEVIVGSAWMTAAMMRFYGLDAESREICDAMVGMLTGPAGLQFRTPAAWDAEGRFRAPMNMRPLAVWFLDLAAG
ncbi:MAG: hypothetical protein EA403_07415 [Spirochaetaceae bacterium]|nr:MAG: hypothetical protein EA403_07415 [Spirochaetaceae bacterium]